MAVPAPEKLKSKLTPAVSKLIFLLLLLLCLGGSARNLGERVRVSLPHMGHHRQQEEAGGAGGKGLGRVTLGRLPRPGLGREQIIRGRSERKKDVCELKTSSEERANERRRQR